MSPSKMGPFPVKDGPTDRAWGGKLTMSWEVQWTFLRVSSHWFPSLRIFPFASWFEPDSFYLPLQSHSASFKPCFLFQKPELKGWQKQFLDPLSFLVGVSKWGTPAKDLREEGKDPQPTIIAPPNPYLHGDITEMWHCVSLRWTWWYDTHIYISK